MQERVIQLIDACTKVCSTQSGFASRLGVGRSNVSNWRSGRYSIPAPMIARMTTIAGLSTEEAREILALIECDRHDAYNQIIMRRAFFGIVMDEYMSESKT